MALKFDEVTDAELAEVKPLKSSEGDELNDTIFERINALEVGKGTKLSWTTEEESRGTKRRVTTILKKMSKTVGTKDREFTRGMLGDDTLVIRRVK